MADEATGCVVTFNGEVYNSPRSAASWRPWAASFRLGLRHRGDPEGLRAVGSSPPSNGSGASSRSGCGTPVRGPSTCVRDPMGIKPLVTGPLDDAAIGEEPSCSPPRLRALLSSGAVRGGSIPRGWRAYLWHGFAVGPGTMIEDVEPPARGAILTSPPTRRSPPPQRPSERRYWHLPSSNGRTATAEELRAELRATVRHAARLRRAARRLSVRRHRLERGRRARERGRARRGPHLHRRVRRPAVRRVPVTRGGWRRDRQPTRPRRALRSRASSEQLHGGASPRSTSPPSTASTPTS